MIRSSRSNSWCSVCVPPCWQPWGCCWSWPASGDPQSPSSWPSSGRRSSSTRGWPDVFGVCAGDWNHCKKNKIYFRSSLTNVLIFYMLTTYQGSTNVSRLTKNDITLDFDRRKTGQISERIQEPRLKSNSLSLSWKLKKLNDPC